MSSARHSNWLAFLLTLSMVSGSWAVTAHGQLGIYVQNLTPRIARTNNLSSEEGVMVVGIVKGSPAEQSGLQRGDVVTHFNKEVVKNVTELQSLVAKTPLGEVVTLSLVRDGEPKDIQTTVQRRQTGANPDQQFSIDDRRLWMILFLTIFFLFLVGISNVVIPILYRHLSAETLLSFFVRSGSHRWIGWVGISITLLLLWSALLVIPPGKSGVVFNLFSGMQPLVLHEGLHLLFPILDRVTVYDVMSRTYTIQSRVEKQGTKQKMYGLWMPTREGMKIGIDATVRYRLDPHRLAELHASVGSAYEAKIVYPLVQSIVRMVVARYSASDLYGINHRVVQEEIFDRLQGAFMRDGIICEGFFLQNIYFPQNFEDSLKREMLAAQKTQELTFEVEQAEKRSAARLYEAQGETEAFEIINSSLRNHPHLLNYIWIKELPHSAEIVVVPPGKGPAAWQRKNHRRSMR